MENISAFNAKTTRLSEKHRQEAAILLQHKEDILDTLAAKGMHEDAEVPHAYYIPVDFSFECGYGPQLPMRAIFAVVTMARASNSKAYFLDCDMGGCPEPPMFTERGEEGFHRVYIADPFAVQIKDAIRRHKEKPEQGNKERCYGYREENSLTLIKQLLKYAPEWQVQSLSTVRLHKRK